MGLELPLLVANIIPYFLFAWASSASTPPSQVAGALNTTTPLFTFALAVTTRTEARASTARATGLLLGLLGAVLIALWHNPNGFYIGREQFVRAEAHAHHSTDGSLELVDADGGTLRIRDKALNHE